MRHERHLLGGAIAIGALLMVTASPINAAGWEPGVPYSAGPGCDFTGNEIDNNYHNPETPFDYKVAGKVKDNTLSGKYIQRYDDVLLQQFDDPSEPHALRWTGTLELRGDLRFEDFADLGTMMPISDLIEFKWRYTFSTIEGEFYAVSSGTIVVDWMAEEIVDSNVYGPCSEP